VVTWRGWDSVGPFLRNEIGGFGKAYYRNPMQSQPHHFEIIAEKDTIRTIVQAVAAKHTTPLIVGRGCACGGCGWRRRGRTWCPVWDYVQHNAHEEDSYCC
jgi:hypothetical protein